MRTKRGLNHVHVGSLHATDDEMALRNARDLYTRRNEGVSIWVVRSERDHRLQPGREGPVLRPERRQGVPPPDVLRRSPTTSRTCEGVMGFDNAYEALTEENDPRWAFGTGFADPLAGVDTTVPAGVDGDDLAAYCLMLGDDALVLSHRLQQWCTNAPTLEDEVALANIALDLLGQARLLLTRAGAADGSGRSEDAFAYFRGRGGVPQRAARRGRQRRLRRVRRAPAGVRHVAAGAAPAPRRIGRPGAGGDRRQGRQGGHLPPRLRGAVGGPPRRRHRPSRTRGWTPPSARCGRSSPSCSRSTASRTATRSTAASPSIPADVARRVRRRDRDRAAGGDPARPTRSGRSPAVPRRDATACTRRRWRRCSPSCRASPAPTRRRRGDAAGRSAHGRRRRHRPGAAAAHARRPRRARRRHASTGTPSSSRSRRRTPAARRWT